MVGGGGGAEAANGPRAYLSRRGSRLLRLQWSERRPEGHLSISAGVKWAGACALLPRKATLSLTRTPTKPRLSTRCLTDPLLLLGSPRFLASTLSTLPSPRTPLGSPSLLPRHRRRRRRRCEGESPDLFASFAYETAMFRVAHAPKLRVIRSVRRVRAFSEADRSRDLSLSLSTLTPPPPTVGLRDLSLALPVVGCSYRPGEARESLNRRIPIIRTCAETRSGPRPPASRASLATRKIICLTGAEIVYVYLVQIDRYSIRINVLLMF